MYKSDIQTHSQATNNQEGQQVRSGRKDSEAQLRKGIFPERHTQGTIESGLTEHGRIPFLHSNKPTAYRSRG